VQYNAQQQYQQAPPASATFSSFAQAPDPAFSYQPLAANDQAFLQNSYMQPQQPQRFVPAAFGQPQTYGGGFTAPSFVILARLTSRCASLI
jgi:hypothetical protein